MAQTVPGYKVYGATAALSVESTMTRETKRYPKGQHTISFEMAVFDPSTNDAVANWDDKLTLQVTHGELPQVIATLSGHAPSITFKFHGVGKNKSYRIDVDADGSTRLTQNAPTRKHTVSLAAHQRFEIVALAMRQLQRRHGALPSDLIYRMLVDCYQPTKPR